MASHDYAWHHGLVHYQKRGMGDPLVLIHNIHPGASLREFDRNIDALARSFTVHAIDLLGFGLSEAPRLKYRAATYIELIFDFLREVVAKPAHVIAAGLSCAYVTEVAAQRPYLFNQLVFICPRSEPTGLDSPRWFAAVRHFLMTTPPLGSGFYETMIGDYELRQFLLENFHHPKNITRELIEQLQEYARRPGAIYPYVSLITGYLDFDLLSALPQVQAPLLLIWGRNAKPTPVEHSVRLAALARQCRVEVVEHAGAWVHQEQSAAVNRILLDTLK